MFKTTILFLIFFYAQSCFAQTGLDGKSERFVVSEIYMAGNKKTNYDIIIRELSISKYAAISKDSLSQVLEINRQRIYNLGIFNDVRLDTASATTTDTIAVIIYLKERFTIIPEFNFQLADRNINVWWKEMNHDLKRVNIGVSVKDKNFRGNLEEFGIAAQVGYTEKISLSYFKPYIDKDKKHGLGVNFNYGRNIENYYTTDRNKFLFYKDQDKFLFKNYDVNLVYVYRPAYASRHLLQLSYTHYQIDEAIQRLNPEYFLNNSNLLQSIYLYYRFELNKTDNWNYSLKGSKLITLTTVQAGITGMKFRFDNNIEAAKYQQLHNRFYSSFIFRGGMQLPGYQPYALRRAMGMGEEYVRGYEYYVIDGSSYAIGRATLKFELLNKTFRNIPIPFLNAFPVRLYPKIYADMGYAYSRFPGTSFLNNRLLNSVGFGLDLISVYDFKVRLEYSINHLKEYGFFIHFTSE